MNNPEQTPHKPYGRRHAGLVATICATLALLTAGICLSAGLAVRSVARQVSSQIGFVAVYNPEIDPEATTKLTALLSSRPYTDTVTVRSADRVLERWEEMVGPEEMLDINPFLPEMEVTVKAPWANADSLTAIAAQLKSLPYIDQVQTHPELASDVSHTLTAIIVIIGLICLGFIAMSIVVIISVVRLQVRAESSRLAAAVRGGMSRSRAARPYMANAAIGGVIAGVIASACLFAARAYFISIEPALEPFLPLMTTAIIALSLTAAGVILMAGAARLAALHYISNPTEEINQHNQK